VRILVVTHNQPTQHTPPYHRWPNCVLYFAFWGDPIKGSRSRMWLSAARDARSDPFPSYNIITPLRLKIAFSFNELPSSRCLMCKPSSLSQGRAISIYCIKHTSVNSTSPAQLGDQTLASDGHLWRSSWQMAIPLTACVWQNALYIVVWLSSEWQAIGRPSRKHGEQTLAQPHFASSPSTIPSPIF